MKKSLWRIATVVLAAFAVGNVAFAQSSGSFSASAGTAECAITDSTGTLVGGITSIPDITVKRSQAGVGLPW
jgi:hypothetical protein